MRPTPLIILALIQAIASDQAPGYAYIRSCHWFKTSDWNKKGDNSVPFATPRRPDNAGEINISPETVAFGSPAIFLPGCYALANGGSSCVLKDLQNRNSISQKNRPNGFIDWPHVDSHSVPNEPLSIYCVVNI